MGFIPATIPCLIELRFGLFGLRAMLAMLVTFVLVMVLRFFDFVLAAASLVGGRPWQIGEQQGRFERDGDYA